MRMAESIDCIVTRTLALELAWDGGELLGTKIGWAGDRTPRIATEAGARMREAMLRYEAGETVAFGLPPLAWEGVSPFARAVLGALAAEVPHGRTVSYGQLASMAGSPGAARAVGRVMAGNRWPLLVPCHRVIGANGSLTGFSGESGLPLKEHLLRLEGAL